MGKIEIKLDTKLPSGRRVDTFLWRLQENGMKKARHIVKTLLKKYTVNYDYYDSSLAYMNHNSRTITVNPLLFLSSIDPMFDKLLPEDYNYEDMVAWNKFMNWGFIGIVCHEIGHALYSLSPDESKGLIEVSGSKSPIDFIHFCSNVVEDSYIQKRMKARFRWDLIQDGINTSTSMFQGFTTCEEFKTKKEFTLHDKLFYFILKSYNPLFEIPAGLDIPESLVDEFLDFYFENCSKERYVKTISWSDNLYEYLKEEVKKEFQKNKQSGQGQQGQQGQEGQGSGNGPGSGSEEMSDADIAQAIQDLVDGISQETGVGSGSSKNQGALKESDINKNINVTSLVGMCNGISRYKSNNIEKLNPVAVKLLGDYNRNFRRLQCHTYGGLTYNLSRGDLNKKQLHKADYNTRVFTRNLSKRRDMDLYFGITLDASGSMRNTYYDLVDIIVPLLHSLDKLNSKSEMLVFSDDTIKVKDYYDTNVSNLYASAHEKNMCSGTELLPSLQYFNSVIRERVHKDKCIIVVTDGVTDEPEKCTEYINKLRQQGVSVIGIGLKLGEDYNWFTKLFGSDILVYNSDEAIRNNIASDLTNYLSNKFMRR